tara:strand:+ start:321 stop:491 length:171 start_codon:yes stop_codon:yes gene_type:complete
MFADFKFVGVVELEQANKPIVFVDLIGDMDVSSIFCENMDNLMYFHHLTVFCQIYA